MRTSCCTFSAGGRVFITPTRSAKMPSPNRHCWTMCDSSPVKNREVTGGTINQRVAIVDHALRIVFPDAPGQIAPGFQQTYWQRAPMGIGRPRLALSRLRVKTPKRTISPLSVDEVARFWSSFRTSRDLAIVGLMLLQGLRSQEVLDLNRDDLLLPEAQIRVRGKGNKTRFLPLAPEAAQLLDHYLRLERPTTSTRRLVRFSQRPCSRHPDDTRWFTLTVSPSSPDHWRQNCQPAPFPTHLRLGYGPRRREPARPHAVDGACANPDHARLYAGHASGGLPAICASGRSAHQTCTGDPNVKLSRHRSCGPPTGSPVPASRRVPHCRPSVGFSPSIPWHRARLPDLSRRRSS